MLLLMFHCVNRVFKAMKLLKKILVSSKVLFLVRSYIWRLSAVVPKSISTCASSVASVDNFLAEYFVGTVLSDYLSLVCYNNPRIQQRGIS